MLALALDTQNQTVAAGAAAGAGVERRAGVAVGVAMDER